VCGGGTVGDGGLREGRRTGLWERVKEVKRDLVRDPVSVKRDLVRKG